MSLPPRRSFQARTIFVDRDQPKRVFEEAALDIPREGCLLRVWYGPGGQGKTALARELYGLLDGTREPRFTHLRRAMLDLHEREKTDPDRLMVWCRNALARSGLAFPAFDLAFAIMWERTRGDESLPNFENAWLQRTGEIAAETVPDLVQVTRELVEEFVDTIPALGFLLRRGASWAFERVKRAWLDETRPQLARLYRDGQLIEDHELAALMPWMLAQDLNRHLVDHPDERFVLFVDEYERVTEGAGTGARWRENPFDSRMRELVAETDGLLACFFTRERLHWEEDPDWRGILKRHQHLLDGLDAGDAERWLGEVPIEDRELRRAMIEGARATRDADAQVYPLMLDLQVEHWRHLGAAAAPDDFRVDADTFEGRRRELVRRLLRDYGDPVQAALERLALAHSFDRAAFEHVVRTFNIPLSFDMFDRLAALSIMSGAEDGWLTPHRAVADAIMQEAGAEVLETARACLVEHFATRVRPELPRDVTDEHLARLREAARLRLGQGVEGYASWLEDNHATIVAAGRSAFLEALWRETLELVRAALGEAHGDTGASYNNVACNLDAQGRHAEAEPLYRMGLEIRRAALGEAHADTGASYNNVACNLGSQGRYAEAEPLYRKGLEITRAALGEAHTDTARSYNNVASNIHAQGRYAEAESLVRKGLEITRAALGEVHASTGTSYNNVALNLDHQGRHAEAEPLYRKGLEITRAALGETHADTGWSYNSTASNLDAQGRYSEAEPLYRKGLEITRAALGEVHASTGTSYNNVALHLDHQGRYAEAEPLYRKALEIRRAALGETHPDTGRSYNSTASNLDAQGRYSEAEPFHRKGLEITRTALGETHPATGASYDDVACNLDSQGRYAEAEPLHCKALEIQRAALGETHSDTRRSYNSTASNLDAQGRYSEAEPLYRKALEITRAALGEVHASTGTNYNNVAFNLDHQGRHAEAEPLHRKGLEITRAALGEAHASTGTSYNNVALHLDHQGRYAEAEPLYRKALEILKAALPADHPHVALAENNLEACRRARRGGGG